MPSTLRATTSIDARFVGHEAAHCVEADIAGTTFEECLHDWLLAYGDAMSLISSACEPSINPVGIWAEVATRSPTIVCSAFRVLLVEMVFRPATTASVSEVTLLSNAVLFEGRVCELRIATIAASLGLEVIATQK